jgi:hypothetical protein
MVGRWVCEPFTALKAYGTCCINSICGVYLVVKLPGIHQRLHACVLHCPCTPFVRSNMCDFWLF